MSDKWFSDTRKVPPALLPKSRTLALSMMTTSHRGCGIVNATISMAVPRDRVSLQQTAQPGGQVKWPIMSGQRQWLMPSPLGLLHALV